MSERASERGASKESSSVFSGADGMVLCDQKHPLRQILALLKATASDNI